jgi:hypothetical protein
MFKWSKVFVNQFILALYDCYLCVCGDYICLYVDCMSVCRTVRVFAGLYECLRGLYWCLRGLYEYCIVFSWTV